MTTTELIPAEDATFEVLPTEVKSASTELSCPSSKAMELYQPFAKPFENAAALLAEEEAATTAAEARALRLKMVKARTTITSTKDESKSDIKLAGNIIDWFHAKGRDRLAAAESRLLEIEKAEERAEAARIEAIREERAETLASLEHYSHGINLGAMSDDNWEEYLQQAKDLFDLRQAREAKAKADAEAKAKAEAEERERQRLEAIRIQAEAKAAAEAAEIERQKALAELAAERAERAKQEAAAAKEKAKAEAAAKAERDKFEAAAAEERRKAMEAAAVETRKRQQAEEEAKALRDAEAKRIADQKVKDDAKAKADAAAAEKAAAAPDREKLQEFAHVVRGLIVPDVQSEEAQATRAEIIGKVAGFANWIESQLNRL